MNRSIAPTALACILLIQGICAKAEAATFNLTQGQWEVTGFDTISWNGSDLVFQTQTPNGANFDITGYVDWYGNGILKGRELFSGTYFANGSLNFSGYQLVNPNGIVLANYTATVSSASQIVNGTWGGFGANSGAWSATNSAATAAPEPFGIIGTLVGGATAFQLRKRLKVSDKTQG